MMQQKGGGRTVPGPYTRGMAEPLSLRSQAADWYNQAWTLLDKTPLTPTETLDLLALTQASFTAWMAVPDHGPVHEAIGAWQVSRAHAVVGEGKLAEAWAHRSLSAASDPSVDPFYRAYAREALARSFRVQGRRSEVVPEVLRARQALVGTAEDELEALEKDLADLESQPRTRRWVQVSVHRPKPGFEDRVIDSMHRYGAAARTQPGLVEVSTLGTADLRVLVGYAVWTSAEAKAAANPALGRAVAGDDFDAWEETAIEGWSLEPR